MKIALLLAVLCVVGCAPVSRINPGSDLAVYIANPAYMDSLRPGSIVFGAYDPSDGSIYLRHGMNRSRMLTTWAHELAHAYDYQRPKDLWELLSRYHSPDFDFNPHEDRR